MLPLKEIPTPADLQRRLINDRNTYLRAYMLGECSVLVTKEDDAWHLSIAHPGRYPRWDEISEARYRLLPEDKVIAMILPPRKAYINIHENCFQMFEIPDDGTFTS